MGIAPILAGGLLDQRIVVEFEMAPIAIGARVVDRHPQGAGDQVAEAELAGLGLRGMQADDHLAPLERGRAPGLLVFALLRLELRHQVGEARLDGAALRGLVGALLVEEGEDGQVLLDRRPRGQGAILAGDLAERGLLDRVDEGSLLVEGGLAIYQFAPLRLQGAQLGFEGAEVGLLVLGEEDLAALHAIDRGAAGHRHAQRLLIDVRGQVADDQRLAAGGEGDLGPARDIGAIEVDRGGIDRCGEDGGLMVLGHERAGGGDGGAGAGAAGHDGSDGCAVAMPQRRRRHRVHISMRFRKATRIPHQRSQHGRGGGTCRCRAEHGSGP